MTTHRNVFLTHEDLLNLEIVRDLFLGEPEDMTSNAPVPDHDNPGKLKGGTAFERCGQHAVKESGRCYSLTTTHQRPRALVGPTSSGKFYDNLEDADEYTLNLDIRGKVTEVGKIYIDLLFCIEYIYIYYYYFSQINARIAMKALKIGAPKDHMQLLEEHADLINLPRVGVDENVAFPAVQANVAPAVSFDDALGIQNYTY
jgi:hypothetical protein